MNDLKPKSNSIANLLRQKGEIEAEIRVYSKIFELEMHLVGFIPYNELNSFEFYKPQMDMNEEVIFTPYRVRLLNMEKTYPVMKRIRLTDGEEPFFIQRQLITPYGTKGFAVYYNAIEKGEEISAKQEANKLLKQVRSSPYYKLNQLSLNEDGGLVYRTSSEEFVSSRTYGDYKVISNRYLCLCAYTNTITGRPCFSLFDPEDVHKIEDVNKDE